MKVGTVSMMAEMRVKAALVVDVDIVGRAMSASEAVRIG
jgi:hypothetical protein